MCQISLSPKIGFLVLLFSIAAQASDHEPPYQENQKLLPRSKLIRTKRFTSFDDFLAPTDLSPVPHEKKLKQLREEYIYHNVEAPNSENFIAWANQIEKSMLNDLLVEVYKIPFRGDISFNNILYLEGLLK